MLTTILKKQTKNKKRTDNPRTNGKSKAIQTKSPKEAYTYTLTHTHTHTHIHTNIYIYKKKKKEKNIYIYIKGESNQINKEIFQ